MTWSITIILSDNTSHIIVTFHRTGINTIIQLPIALITNKTTHIVISFYRGTI